MGIAPYRKLNANRIAKCTRTEAAAKAGACEKAEARHGAGGKLTNARGVKRGRRKSQASMSGRYKTAKATTGI
jgi:hypothetical protein